jgi:hypothetical protein
MIEYIRRILAGQFEAALCMMHHCVKLCPPQHWEGKIANDAFKQVAYHTLFFADLYLSPREEALERRDFHGRGGDERGPALSPGLDQEKTLEYSAICRQKMPQIIGSETAESLQGPSGFSWIKFSRGELHIYNIRHIAHHAGQLSAFLRRVDPSLATPQVPPWIGTGWK